MKGYATTVNSVKAIVSKAKWIQMMVSCLTAVNVRRHPSGRRGFTLIELVVVIGIIVLIAAIIFPVISNARKRALYTIDISNLRQIGLAIRMYQQDYGGFPTLSDSALAVFECAYELLPYTGSSKVFDCPMDQRFSWPSSRPPCTQCIYSSYGLEYLPSPLDPTDSIEDWPVYLQHPSDYPLAVDQVHWYQAGRRLNELPPILRDRSLVEPAFVLRGDGRVSTWRIPVANFAWSTCHIIQIATGEWPAGCD